MRPIIGVFAEVYDDLHTQMQSAYARAIECSGGVPFVLPYVDSNEAIEDFIVLCDGFFFTGGADIDPQSYGEARSPHCGESQPNRDALELRVFKKAIKTQKPILGVCRGAQLVNVALGGTLYQDLPSERSGNVAHRQAEPKDAPSHDVSVLADTPLYRLIGKARMRANSFHHQAIKQLGAGLAVMATADDGVIEAVYLQGQRYLRAYQWHPERIYEADLQNKHLFDDFVSACRTPSSEQ